MTATIPHLTEASLHLFTRLANDAGNWSGQPLIGGNFPITQQDKGNLSDLVKKNLIEIQMDEEWSWAVFTEKGQALAKSLDIDLCIYD